MPSDSIEKIIDYLDAAGLKTLVLSPKWFRDYTCPSKCGACCRRYSMDFFDGSPRWKKFKSRYPKLAKENFKLRVVRGARIWSDLQKEGVRLDGKPLDWYCRYLDTENGRCGIWLGRPFSCEFELMKLKKDERSGKRPIGRLTQQLYGRGWNMKRIDGGRGARCEMKPMHPDKLKRDIALVEELLWMAKAMGKRTHLAQVLSFLRKNSLKMRSGRFPKKPVKFGDKR